MDALDQQARREYSVVPLAGGRRRSAPTADLDRRGRQRPLGGRGRGRGAGTEPAGGDRDAGQGHQERRRGAIGPSASASAGHESGTVPTIVDSTSEELPATAVAIPADSLRGSPVGLPSPQPTPGRRCAAPPWITSRDGSTAMPHASSARSTQSWPRGRSARHPPTRTAGNAHRAADGPGHGTRQGQARGPGRPLHRGRRRAPARRDRERDRWLAVYVEYLQLVHTRDGWKIVNALWANSTPSQDQ